MNLTGNETIVIYNQTCPAVVIEKFLLPKDVWALQICMFIVIFSILFTAIVLIFSGNLRKTPISTISILIFCVGFVLTEWLNMVWPLILPAILLMAHNANLVRIIYGSLKKMESNKQVLTGDIPSTGLTWDELKLKEKYYILSLVIQIWAHGLLSYHLIFKIFSYFLA